MHGIVRVLVELDGERIREADVEIGYLHRAFELTYEFAVDPKGWLILMGSYGCGKTHLAAAIANALEDATGVRITDLPLTPEKVWRAIHKKDEEA